MINEIENFHASGIEKYSNDAAAVNAAAAINNTFTLKCCE